MILHLIPFQVKSILFCLFTAVIFIVLIVRKMEFFKRKKKTVDVVVLGDLGRSPRMANHAISLANEGFNVQLVGYEGSQLGTEITENPNITIQTMKEPRAYHVHKTLDRYINYTIKCIWQSLTLLCCLGPRCLWRGGIPDFILLQNPPSIPALVICYFVSLLFNHLISSITSARNSSARIFSNNFFF